MTNTDETLRYRRMESKGFQDNRKEITETVQEVNAIGVKCDRLKQATDKTVNDLM
jgi:hypothetical protein